MDWFEAALTTVLEWLNDQPIVEAMLWLMGIDYVSGTLLAIKRRAINSTIGTSGMLRKAQTIVLVGATAIIERLIEDVPLSKVTAGFFCATEAWSIMENASGLGVPIPKFLRDSLKKLSDSEVELEVPKQIIVARQHAKRPSDLPELVPKKDAADSPVIKTDEPA